MKDGDMHLRKYQEDAIDAVFKAWDAEIRRPAVVLPTGAGKTVVFSHLADRFRKKQTGPLEEFKVGSEIGPRVMILVHRDELADQAIAKIKAVIPDVSVGKVKAADNGIAAPIMVCSVQTLARARRREAVINSQSAFGDVGLIITDECHHAAATSYKRIYADFPNAVNVGFTATLARGDGVGLGSVWDDVVYTRSVLRMIADGFLVDPRSVAVDVAGLDLAAVKTVGRDFSAASLGEALEESGADEVIAQAYVKYAGSRPGVVFTPTVQTATDTAEALVRAGVTAETISGETPAQDRRRIYDRFRTGDTQVLVNCMVLTEGFDAPWAEVAVIARPTQSQPLYAQMVGRVLRPWPGKKSALVLNLAGSSGKLRTLIDLDPGAVQQVKDGESLADAYLREEMEADRPVRAGSPMFELRMRDVDMFAGSRANWLRTAAGVQFIPGGSNMVFLWPEPEGTWSVCLAPKGEKWQRLHTGLGLEMAMAWGESEAEDHAEFSPGRSARWRSGPPTDKQETYARRIGVWEDGMTKATCGDAISVKMASLTFDRWVAQNPVS